MNFDAFWAVFAYQGSEVGWGRNGEKTVKKWYWNLSEPNQKLITSRPRPKEQVCQIRLKSEWRLLSYRADKKMCDADAAAAAAEPAAAAAAAADSKLMKTKAVHITCGR